VGVLEPFEIAPKENARLKERDAAAWDEFVRKYRRGEYSRWLTLSGSSASIHSGTLSAELRNLLYGAGGNFGSLSQEGT
jgi:hypothetical protein